jgi:hypothetical protein
MEMVSQWNAALVVCKWRSWQSAVVTTLHLVDMTALEAPLARMINRASVKGTPGRVAQNLWRRYTKAGSYLFHYDFEDWLAEIGVLAANS